MIDFIRPNNFIIRGTRFLKKGENVQIGEYSIINAHGGGIEIENNVEIAYGVIIIAKSTVDKKCAKVVLKEGCYIGSNSIVMPGITVGKGSIIGANSFVNKNIPDSEMWFGTPVKFYRKLDGY